MFDFFTAAVENGLDIIDGLVEGEMPTKRQLAKMVDAGVSIFVIAELTGFSVDVIQNYLNEE